MSSVSVENSRRPERIGDYAAKNKRGNGEVLLQSSWWVLRLKFDGLRVAAVWSINGDLFTFCSSE